MSYFCGNTSPPHRTPIILPAPIHHICLDESATIARDKDTPELVDLGGFVADAAVYLCPPSGRQSSPEALFFPART